MSVGYIRVLFVLISSVLGYQIAGFFYGLQSEYAMYGLLIGTGSAIGVIIMELSFSKVSLRGMSAVVFGLFLALIMSNLISIALNTIEMDERLLASIKLVLVLVLSYLGIVFSLRGRDEFSVIIPYVKFQRQDHPDNAILLDTSAVIDGRVLDLIKTPFLQGHFIIPKFVLKELQQLADSDNELKRNKGRRGLDILNKMKRNPKFKYRFYAEDVEGETGVDQKLLKLAKMLDARIVTTDFNLNKVAEFQNIDILNVHELTLALRRVVLHGEQLEVQLAKPGTEREQAIGYLNDGTMVVVEDARHLIGKACQAQVTSVLQTPAGRMIFSKIANAPA